MTAKCYYTGFGTVYHIEFHVKDTVVFNNGIVNKKIEPTKLKDYTYESVAFYILAAHIKHFFEQNNSINRIIVFSSIEADTIAAAMNDPKTPAEIYLSELFQNRKIAFDSREDGKTATVARNVLSEYLRMRSEGLCTDFNTSKDEEDPFRDPFADRYHIYQ